MSQTHVDRGIQENPECWPEQEQQSGADRGSDHHGQIPAGRAHTHGARQLLGHHDPMDQDLGSGGPSNAGETMRDEQRRRLPHGHGVAHEHHAPTHRHADEQQHPDLDQPADIETVGECARIPTEQQKRNPVGNDGKPAERG